MTIGDLIVDPKSTDLCESRIKTRQLKARLSIGENVIMMDLSTTMIVYIRVGIGIQWKLKDALTIFIFVIYLGG